MWKDSYAIGVELLDNQHRQLFEAVEILMKTPKIDLSPKQYRGQIEKAVKFLKMYCVKHFQDEEAYHLEIGYAEREKHKKLHRKLIEGVLKHEKRLIDSDFDYGIVKKFFGFVMTGLIYHVAGEDQKLNKASVEEIAAQARGSVQDFAARAKKVLRTVTGLASEDIALEVGADRRIMEGVCYTVGLVGGQKKGIGIVFSNTIAFGALKAMTSMELTELNEVVYSALQEISNIVSSRIADAVALAKGSEFCDIDHPVRVDIADVPQGIDSFSMRTSIGDMEIVVY